MIRNGPTELSDGLVRLREICREDSETLYRWRMHPRIRGAFRHNEVAPREDHEQLISQYFSPGNTDRWFIAEARGVPIGTLALVKFSADSSECEIGRLIIVPEYWGLSIAGRALRLLVDYGRRMGLRRIRAEIWEKNRSTLAYAPRMGFTKAGSYTYRGRRFLIFVWERDPEN